MEFVKTICWLEFKHPVIESNLEMSFFVSFYFVFCKTQRNESHIPLTRKRVQIWTTSDYCLTQMVEPENSAAAVV